jgi:hypothetical protein
MDGSAIHTGRLLFLPYMYQQYLTIPGADPRGCAAWEA